MDKILVLDDYFPTGEISVQPVLLYGPGGNRLDVSRVVKTASEALDYIKNVSPEPGKTHLLLLALGAEEAYGPNRNGDGFPARPVPARGKVASSGRRWWVPPGEELVHHYKSFETNPAHAFKHHVNKDPKKASGHVKKAFYNNRMHRVELLVVIDNDKDPEWVQRTNDGEFVPVSMGCRIKRDVCSICGNEAPTRAQYCDCVTRSPGMNQLMPDGKRAYVHNPSPSFFDISRVFRPADKQGYTLKKVAHVYEIRSSAELGDEAEDLARKAAALRKLSDIDKVVRGEPIASASNLSPMETEVIRRFAAHAAPKIASAPRLPIAELAGRHPHTVLSTLASLKLAMSSGEFLEYMTSTMAGGPVALPVRCVVKAAELQPTILRLLAESPALLDEVVKTGMLDESPEYVDAELRERLSDYAVKRAQIGEMLYRRLVPEGIGLRADAAPTTDLLSYTDPRSGQAYQTTRGAAIDARDMRTTAGLGKMLGGGALLYGGYKLLSAMPSLRQWRLPLGIGAGLLGMHALRSPRSDYLTNEGIPIPSSTEFAPGVKQGSVESLAHAVIGLLEDYACLSREKLASIDGDDLVQQLVKNAYVDNVRGVELDLDLVAAELGRAILS